MSKRSNQNIQAIIYVIGFTVTYVLTTCIHPLEMIAFLEFQFIMSLRKECFKNNRNIDAIPKITVSIYITIITIVLPWHKKKNISYKLRVKISVSAFLVCKMKNLMLEWFPIWSDLWGSRISVWFIKSKVHWLPISLYFSVIYWFTQKLWFVMSTFLSLLPVATDASALCIILYDI